MTARTPAPAQRTYARMNSTSTPMESLVVVGAGPAGCAAAMSAASAAPDLRDRILLIESALPGSDKPCAGGLVPDSVETLQAAGWDDSTFDRIGGSRFRRVVARHDGGRSTERSVSGWVVPRAAFDNELRIRSGRLCRVAYGSRVVNVERAGTRWRLSVRTLTDVRSVDAQAVIFAHGSGGTLAVERGMDGRPIRAAAIVQRSRWHRLGESLYLNFPRSLSPGYVWWFPSGPTGANWGGCVLGDGQRKMLQAIRLRMQTLAKLGGFTQPRIAPEHLWSGRGTQWHQCDGLISAGDAAGLIDPFSGEGISAALVSGAQAGKTMADFLGGDSRAPERYSEWIRNWFSRAYRADGSRAAWWQTL